jgi:hypothetical protein
MITVKEMRMKILDIITDFGKGIIAGFLVSALIFGLVLGLIFQHLKTREINKYVETQQIIDELREDYGSRDPVEFLETMPGVRGAADSATAEFEQRRGEAVQRFRDGLNN